MPAMHEYVNSTACLVMMIYALPVASVMGGRWWHKLTFAAVVASLGLQVMAPWEAWIPPISWVSTVFHVALSGVLTVWRLDAWGYVLHKFASPARRHHPLRRQEDWGHLRRQTYAVPRKE